MNKKITPIVLLATLVTNTLPTSAYSLEKIPSNSMDTIEKEKENILDENISTKTTGPAVTIKTYDIKDTFKVTDILEVSNSSDIESYEWFVDGYDTKVNKSNFEVSKKYENAKEIYCIYILKDGSPNKTNISRNCDSSTTGYIPQNKLTLLKSEPMLLALNNSNEFIDKTSYNKNLGQYTEDYYNSKKDYGTITDNFSEVKTYGKKSHQLSDGNILNIEYSTLTNNYAENKLDFTYGGKYSYNSYINNGYANGYDTYYYMYYAGKSIPFSINVGDSGKDYAKLTIPVGSIVNLEIDAEKKRC